VLFIQVVIVSKDIQPAPRIQEVCTARVQRVRQFVYCSI